MNVPRSTVHTILITLAISLSGVEQGHALETPLNTDEAPSEVKQEEYHTPLAGEACTISLLGKNYVVPMRDRCNALALTLGGTAFHPSLATLTSSRSPRSIGGGNPPVPGPASSSACLSTS